MTAHKNRMTDTSTETIPEPAQEDGTLPAGLRFTPNERVADRVVPTEDIYTWTKDKPVKLKLTPDGPGSREPLSVPSLLRSTVEKIPDHKAFVVERDEKILTWTYKKYHSDVIKAAKSFIKLGVEMYDGVGIIGFNSPEWVISDIAAIYAGGLAVGIYTTNNPEACHYVLEASKCRVVVVENDIQLQKILQVWERLPNLKAVVQYTGELSDKRENVYTWSEFLKLGKYTSGWAVQDRLDQMAVNKCCTLVFTSGTTGRPKGVMANHDNYTYTCWAVSQKFPELQFGEERFVSYLPLSHSAAQMSDIFLPLVTGATLYFARPDALKGSLAHTLRQARPTMFFGVPRVYEKFEEAIKTAGRSTTGLKKIIVDKAKEIGLQGNKNLLEGEELPWGWTLADMLVFSKVKETMGLDKSKLFLAGAAPLLKDTLEYFMSINIMINDNYGMSETTAPHTMSMPGQSKMGSVGKVLPGCDLMLLDKDEQGNGEICMRGRNSFMGYLDMEDKTKETIDEDGYVHSGDIGKIDEQGFLYITGRIKELIITAGGENIPPVIIETIVKEELPVVSQCMLIGDKRKFLSMLITLKVEVDKDTMVPSDTLSALALDWCKSVGSSATCVSQILNNNDEQASQAIQAGIDRANKRATSRAQTIQKWTLLPSDFSIPGGELGPTMKLRRQIVLKKYEQTIEEFYS